MMTILICPPFTKSKRQLGESTGRLDRELSIVCIHIEHVISILKQKYTMLLGTLPISFTANKDQEAATVDKLVSVCCVLVPSVVIYSLLYTYMHMQIHTCTILFT